MKKIALMASTENVFKLKELFEATPLLVDFILFNKNFQSDGNYDFGHFSDQSILIDQLMIPVFENEVRKRTPLQAQKFNHLAQEMDHLKKLVFQNNLDKIELGKSFKTSLQAERFGHSNKENANNIYLSNQIKDMTIDQKSGQIKFEINQSGLLNYDHVLLENNDRIYEFVQRFCPKHFQTTEFVSFQFVGFKFLMSDHLTNNYFWMVDDSLYESVYDNFYFINAQNSHADVWTWIPEQQLKSSEYFRFISQRVRNRMEKKFDFISFSLTSKEFLTQPLNPASRYQMKSSPFFSPFPHFNFLNPLQTENIFWSKIEKLNKKVVFHTLSKEKKL